MFLLIYQVFLKVGWDNLSGVLGQFIGGSGTIYRGFWDNLSGV